MSYSITFLCLDPMLHASCYGEALLKRLRIAAINDGHPDIQYEQIIHKQALTSWGITPGPTPNGAILVVYPLESYRKPTSTAPASSIPSHIYKLILDAMGQCSQRTGKPIRTDNLTIDPRATSLIERRAKLIMTANDNSTASVLSVCPR